MRVSVHLFEAGCHDQAERETTTLPVCLRLAISHISPTCGLYKQATLFIDMLLKLTLASDLVSLVVDSMPTSLIASVTFLAIN